MDRAIHILAMAAALGLFSFQAFASSTAGLRLTSFSDGAVVPANWRHPVIAWSDDGPAPDGAYKLVISAGSLEIQRLVRGNHLELDDTRFDPMLKIGTIRFEISRTLADGSVIRAAATVVVDREEFSDRVVYRLVEPYFNPSQAAILRTQTMEEAIPSTFTMASTTCLGCHAWQGDSALLNTRRGSDRRLITMTASRGGRPDAEFRQAAIGEFSFASLSPDGRTAALVLDTKSMITTRQAMREPFDMTYTQGKISLLDLASGRTDTLPGADDPGYVNDQPSWSPDGRRLVFCRYQPSPGTTTLKPTRLWLVEVNGGQGSEIRQLATGAAGEQVWFPRFSPDGQWISFVSGDASHSYFARQSADIWLYSLATGHVRKLDFCQADTMESWHAWSADGRWLVFSRRGPSGLTTLALARVQADGRAASAVQISWDASHKANLPFLVPAGPGLAARMPGLGAFLKDVYRN